MWEGWIGHFKATEIFFPPALTEEANKSPKLIMIFSLSMQSC